MVAPVILPVPGEEQVAINIDLTGNSNWLGVVFPAQILARGIAKLQGITLPARIIVIIQSKVSALNGIGQHAIDQFANAVQDGNIVGPVAGIYDYHTYRH